MPKRRSRPEAIPSAQITLDPHNANRGTSRGREALRKSLEDYGPGRAVLSDRQGVLIAGNKTYEEALRLRIPVEVIRSKGDRLYVIQREDLDLTVDPGARNLAIADNRVGELDLDWDLERLAEQLRDNPDAIHWWTPAELAGLVRDPSQKATEDHSVQPRSTDILVGDEFRLGDHHLLCGDATNADDVARVLADIKPQLMVTDPPYGVDYRPAWRSRALPGQRTAVGEVRNDNRADWGDAFRLYPGDVAYVFHAGLHAAAVAASLTSCDFHIRSQIIWVKPHFALSRGDYHWQHEPCWYAIRRGQPSNWQGDRTQSTVWAVPNLNPFGGDRGGENAVTGHSTQKPVGLFERALLNHTVAGDAMYDPFVGSGTAIIAAEKTGRIAYALDLDPIYIQATIDRWEAYTGKRAIRLQGANRKERT